MMIVVGSVGGATIAEAVRPAVGSLVGMIVRMTGVGVRPVVGSVAMTTAVIAAVSVVMTTVVASAGGGGGFLPGRQSR